MDLHEERVLPLQPNTAKDKVSGTVTVKLDYTTDNFLKKQEAMKVQEREKLINDVHSNLIPLEEVKDLAVKFQAANKAGGNSLRSPEDLAALLTTLGLWEKMRSANVFGMGESVATVATKFDPTLKEKVLQDAEFKKVTAEFLFRLFDSDHDNQVTFNEFVVGLAMHTKSSEADRVRFRLRCRV
jgi:hypothetical protein